MKFQDKEFGTYLFHNDDNNAQVAQSQENRKKGDIKLMLL